MSVRYPFDQQDPGPVTKGLGDELSVHGQLFAVEGPLNGQRCVSLEDVTGERDIVTIVQGFLGSVNGKFWGYCNEQ